MNIFGSKVSFVNILRAHRLETKKTWTGPTVGATIIYDTYCYCCTFGALLFSLTTRYDIIIECTIHSLGY